MLYVLFFSSKVIERNKRKTIKNQTFSTEYSISVFTWIEFISMSNELPVSRQSVAIGFPCDSYRSIHLSLFTDPFSTHTKKMNEKEILEKDEQENENEEIQVFVPFFDGTNCLYSSCSKRKAYKQA